MNTDFEELLGTAVLGVDTLWGGDVMCPSGTGRFIADSWFSGKPLPAAYTSPRAARVRKAGGLSAETPDLAAIEAYLQSVDIHGAIMALHLEEYSRDYIRNLADCLEVMWDLGMEMLGKGDPVPYARCVAASTGRLPEPSRPAQKRERVLELLAADGFSSVQEWRRAHIVPMASIKSLGAAVTAWFDQLTEANIMPHLPAELQNVPRANVEFQPVAGAWFSGSLNYKGRGPAGKNTYEATYEINASLAISVPEFLQLVSREVVPGRVTTCAYLQNLYARGEAGFEASVPAMNTRGATLVGGIANNAILMAYGVTEVDQLPDRDLQIGVLLALLQDEAKNQASYMTWQERWPKPEIAKILQNEYLVSEDRASTLSNDWGPHPLLGRMHLPSYRAGTERVAEWRRQHKPERYLPLLYGCYGLMDITTAENVLTAHRTGA